MKILKPRSESEDTETITASAVKFPTLQKRVFMDFTFDR